MLKRPRRNRKNKALRALVEESVVRPSDLVYPFFLLPGENRKEEISSLPFIHRLSLDNILQEAERLHAKGIEAIALFPFIPREEKDLLGKEALNPNGLIPKAIQTLKKELPSLCLITDIALDPYTSHGHDGIVGDQGNVLNDPTVEVLAKMALLHAQSGVDIVAPSDMMDGRVLSIRQQLDSYHFYDTNILSYSAKYASSLYSPFREALNSELQFGDKKTYQLNPSNSREALLECSLDEVEGADILMIKPAIPYLDVLTKLRAATHLPLAAYHVSGEYAMVMAAHERGFLQGPQTFLESLQCIKRAGADIIFTYAVPLVIDMII